jgi:hypothetical protein
MSEFLPGYFVGRLARQAPRRQPATLKTATPKARVIRAARWYKIDKNMSQKEHISKTWGGS